MDDDEMVVIIIGNENADPLLIPIKDEPGDELKESNLNAESILETAELYGEHISTIKEEKEEEYEYEYLEDTEESGLQLEKQGSREITTENDNSKSSGDTVKNNIKPKKQKINDRDHEDVAPPKNQLSYVAQLRKNFPKMRKDENFLILHLVNVMKNTKFPAPPIDFCVPNGGRLACAYCPMESPNIPTACRHYQERHGPRVFVCLACGSNFRCTTGLYKHEKNCKAPDANLVLKARGQYLGRNSRHRPYPYHKKFGPDGLKPEESVKKYFCSLCTASFKQKEALQAHEYMHRGMRPFQCDKCPMAYTSNVALRRHLLSHTDAEYICDICKCTLKSKPTLIVHLNRHLPQPKYPCDKCERRFTQKITLKGHIDRDHLNIPSPFACVACPKRCQRITSLRSHMQIRHGLTLISRRMFFKALPSMKQTEELKHATVVFNHSEYYVQKKKHNTDNKNDSVDDESTITVEDHEEAEKCNSTAEVQSEREVSPVTNDNEDAMDTEEVINSVDIQDDNLEDGTIEDAENILYTPKKQVVKTSLPERSELEIMTSVAKSSVQRNKKSKPLKIDLSMARSNRNKSNINIPVLTDDLNKNDFDNDITNFIIFNENEREIEISVKDVNYESGTKPINQRINVKKVQSNSTKTRSRVIVKKNEIIKNISVRKQQMKTKTKNILS